jgi:hypothetical protein
MNAFRSDVVLGIDGLSPHSTDLEQTKNILLVDNAVNQ